MPKSNNSEPETLIDRFNKRREKVAAEKIEEQLGAKQLVEADTGNGEDVLSDHELLEKYELPDPETVEDEAGLNRFFDRDMPERLRSLALRRVWRLNPLFRFADEMVEYGEDYTDAATVIEGMQTAYQVGKGYLTKAKEAIENGSIDDDSDSENGFDNKSKLDSEENDDKQHGNNGSNDAEGLGGDGSKANSTQELSPQETKDNTAAATPVDERTPIEEESKNREREMLGSDVQHDKALDLISVKNDTSDQKKDQNSTVLEEAEYQLVRPKKMVFVKPAK